jgi:hypothetical protein
MITRRPAPISLRLSPAESTRRARALLSRLDHRDTMQRQVTKALTSIRVMESLMSPVDEVHLGTECKTVRALLEKIKEAIR